jgi:hypothetical protein
VTSQELGTPHSAGSDSPDTEVIVVSSPVPVFVDSTGRRRRLLRRLSYGFGGLCMVYGGLVSVSLAGGPVSSSAVLPLPDLHDNDAEEATGPRPAPIPLPSVSARPIEVYIADVAPRRRVTPDVTRVVPPRRPAPIRTSAKPSPSAAPTSVKPTESGPLPTVPVSPVPSTTPTVPVPPPPPVPLSSGGTGGSGGGGEAPEEDETLAAPETSLPGTSPPGTSPPESSRPETTESADTPEPSAAAEPTA